MQEVAMPEEIMVAETKDAPLVERQQAPEIFVDGFEGFTMTNGVIKIPLFSNHYDPNSKTNERRVVAHLACAIATVETMRQGFSMILDDLVKAGAIQKAPVPTSPAVH